MRRILKHVGHPFLVWFLGLSYLALLQRFHASSQRPVSVFSWTLCLSCFPIPRWFMKKGGCFSGDGYSALSMADGCENMDHPHWPLR